FLVAMSRGATEDDVAAALVGSAEFLGRFGGDVNAALAGLSLTALGRPIDPTAQAALGAAAAQGGLSHAARVALGSAEHLTGVVVGQYIRFLGRVPNAPEGLVWVQNYRGGIRGDARLALFLGASGEFFGRAQTV